MFLQMGLDSPNQIDPVQEIRPSARADGVMRLRAKVAGHPLSLRHGRARRRIGEKSRNTPLRAAANATNYDDVDRTCQNLSKRCEFSGVSPAN